MADLNKPAFYPRVGNITPRPRAPLAQTEVREQPLDPIMRVFKDLMDRSSELIDKSKVTPYDVTKGLISAIPFEGERFAKDFSQSTMPVPTGFGLLPTASPEGLDTSGMGMQSVRVPTKEALNELKWSDLVGTAGASRMFEALGQNRTPEFFDTLDAATLGLGGLSAARAAPKVAKAVGEGAKTVGMGGLEMIDRGMFGEGPLRNFVPQHKFVMKPKGGNWFGTSVEDAMTPFKRGAHEVDPRDAAELGIELSPQDAAINKWVDSNLTNYVKKQMATPEDPVRKLAEEGIVHIPTNEVGINRYRAPEHRKRYEGEQLGQSDAAKAWEDASDVAINAPKVSEIKSPGFIDRNPYVEKLSPDERIYGLNNPASWRQEIDGLGFNHIIDVLSEDVASGRIRPEQLNKVSMEQAVRRTHEYDQELLSKMNSARATAREGLPVYKDYPEGYKWIQLTRPGDFAAESQAMGHSVKGYEPPFGHPDWVEGSGDKGSSSYGLGGWEAIKSGKAKVYSLVDAKGEPHATIEVDKGRHPLGTTGRGNNFPDELRYGEYDNSYAEIPKEKQQEIYELGKKLYYENPNAYAENRILSGDKTPDIMDSFQKAADMLLGERPGSVRQIKGKGNARPIEKYDPYTQDFVKSGGWSDVRDLQNTGLFNVDNKYFTEPELIDVATKYGRVGVMDTPWEVARQRHIDAGVPEEEALTNWVEAFKEGRGRLQMPRDVPPDLEGMKRGGKVSISNNPDTMMLELGNQKMAGGGAIAKLVRAAPKTAAEIDAIARRMAPQMLGEFVRGDKGTQSVAGKTQKQFAKEKEMVHDIRSTGAERALPKDVDFEKLKDQVMVGIAGDPTISGKTIYSVNGIPLDSPSPQHGGPLYGLEHEGDAFWASGLGAANRVQNIAREASKQYDLPVIGNYVMMGPDSINYAQHYADANLAAINPSKMSRGQIEDFNKLVRLGSKKSGPRPSFPGIENPSEAYLHFSIDPELRKHFNALMQMPTVTEKYNLPSGVDIRHAVTEPDLRDLEIGVTGKSIGRLRPEIENLNYSEHPTYSHDIPGEFIGSSKYNIPYELSFPDSVKAVRENPKQAPQEFGSFKYVGPRQVIDQQLIDEIKQYQEMIKKYTGKKKGGAIKKAAGGAITGDDLILEERPL